MVAAAITLWTMFSLWMLAPLLDARGAVRRLAGAVLGAELVALLAWSYGTEHCDGRACAPLVQVAGIAARTDLPALAAVVVVVSVVHIRRASAA